MMQFCDIPHPDEATFYLNSSVISQNCICWSKENPHWISEGHTSQKINFWSGMITDTINGLDRGTLSVIFAKRCLTSPSDYVSKRHKP